MDPEGDRSFEQIANLLRLRSITGQSSVESDDIGSGLALDFRTDSRLGHETRDSDPPMLSRSRPGRRASLASAVGRVLRRVGSAAECSAVERRLFEFQIL